VSDKSIEHVNDLSITLHIRSADSVWKWVLRAAPGAEDV